MPVALMKRSADLENCITLEREPMQRFENSRILSVCFCHSVVDILNRAMFVVPSLCSAALE